MGGGDEKPSPNPSSGDGGSQDSGDEPPEERIKKKPEGVPESWVGQASDKQGGIKYTDPTPKSGNEVRVMPGRPNSPYPNSQGPNVRWTRNGQYLDRNGNPVPKKSPESHIPLKDFKFDPKLYKQFGGFYV